MNSRMSKARHFQISYTEILKNTGDLHRVQGGRLDACSSSPVPQGVLFFERRGIYRPDAVERVAISRLNAVHGLTVSIRPADHDSVTDLERSNAELRDLSQME